MKFTTTILGSGNKAGIEVPEEVLSALGAGKRPPVVVTINGKSYRSSIAVMGGQNLIGVSTANREFTGVAAGDTIEVDVELDTQPRIIEVPDDLAAALAAEPEAQAFYATLAYETRARRITKMVADLKAGRK
jgi:hypothetical protein